MQQLLRSASAVALVSACVFAAACSSDSGSSGDDQPPAGNVDASGPPGACGPATCDGCCDGDVCLSGQAPDACGGGGAACQVCGPSFLCSAAACQVDPASRWDVVAVSGDVFADNAGGTPWDPAGGLPDPYVELTAMDDVDTYHGQSDAPANTLAPEWNQAVLSDVPARALTGGITATLWDADPVGGNDSMGTCPLTPDDDSFGGNQIETVCPPDQPDGVRGWTLRWQVRRH